MVSAASEREKQIRAWISRPSAQWSAQGDEAYGMAQAFREVEAILDGEGPEDV